MSAPTLWIIVSDLFFLSKLRTSLETQGATVKVSPNPETLLKAPPPNPDLVILDLGLGGMPPAEFIRKLRESGQMNVPVLAFTNHARIPQWTENINDRKTKVVSNSFISDKIKDIVGLLDLFNA